MQTRIKHPGRPHRAIIAPTLLVCCAIAGPMVHAAPVTYNYVDVAYIFGSGSSVTRTGSETSVNVSTNGPGASTTGTLDYVFGALADPGSVSSGHWTDTGGPGSLYGRSQALSEQFGYAGSPFARYTGTRSIDGGTGHFAGATGSGTYEFYAIYFGTGDPDTFAYQGIFVNRMSVTVDTDAPLPQPDQRPVYVLLKNGAENLEAGTGVNNGLFTSASPGLIPWATEEASYTFEPLPIAGPPFSGTFTDENANGTVSGTFFGPGIERNHLGTFFNYAPGTSITTSGTGDYVSATGSSSYEAISYTLGGPSTEALYANVVVVRVNPVPEASTWVMVLAGLGVLAGIGRRGKH